MGPLPRFDAEGALARFRARASRERIVPRPSWSTALAARISLARPTWTRPALAALAIAAIATVAGATGVADTILTVFEPKQVATVQVDPRQLGSIPDPSGYGTLTWIAQPSFHPVADAAAAAAEAGFTPLVPASLPAGVPTTARYAAMGQAKATFQFDEAKARAAAAKVGATPPPMPPAIAATTLTITGGPTILQQYGSAPNVPADQAAWGGDPVLLIVQGRAPLVTSNGAAVEELRDYALAQPGVPPALAAQIRAIGDPVRTLLIPVGVDLQDTKLVTVRGTQGYLIGDQTGVGTGIVWLERGYVVGVLASLTESDLIALVNGLR